MTTGGDASGGETLVESAAEGGSQDVFEKVIRLLHGEVGVLCMARPPVFPVGCHSVFQRVAEGCTYMCGGDCFLPSKHSHVLVRLPRFVLKPGLQCMDYGVDVFAACSNIWSFIYLPRLSQLSLIYTVIGDYREKKACGECDSKRCCGER